jgi:hypothetical protein
MAAGQGFKTFVTGEVLTAGDVNGYLMQGINVFASTAARDAAITVPAEGQFAFTKDTNGLWYYDGAAWVASGATGDIEGVTAGVGISGGGTSGTVTVTNSMATAIDAKGDLVPGTGADTFARLAVGANDTVLTADSSTATGLKWASPSGPLASWSQLAVSATTSGTTVTISGLSGYNQLYVQFENISHNDSIKEFYFRMNTDSGTNYNYVNFSIRNPAAQTSGGFVSGGTEIYLGRAASSGNTMVGGISINGANSTGKKFLRGFMASTNDLVSSDITQPHISGTYDGTSVISSVSIVTNAAAFDGGNMRVFGSVS